MEYQYLGNSGLQVSRLVMGTMTFGSKKWAEWVIEDEEEVMKLLKHAYDQGIRTFDTADMYSDGESERLIGKFLKKYKIPRSTVVIMSKVWAPVNDLALEMNQTNLVNRMGLSRKHIMDAVDDSVERLGTYIDVYQIHRLDNKTPYEEIMRALNDCVKSGKVRYLGASTMRTYEFVELQSIAERNGWSKFISMQNFYHLAYREEEREMIPYCKKHNIGLIPWSPLGRGVLARPYQPTKSERAKSDQWFFLMEKQEATTKAVVDQVEKVANKKGVSMAQVAIAWSLAKGCAPILGLNSTKRIDEAVAALKVKLTEEEIKQLEEPYVTQPPLGYVD